MNLTRRNFVKFAGATLISVGLIGIDTGCGFNEDAADGNFVKDWVTLQIDDFPIEYNGRNYSRVLVIGDIHGNYTRFMSMYQKLEVTDNDLLIFLGDYIQGDKVGEDLKTLQWLIKQQKKHNFIILSGNMERKALKECFTGDGNLKENLGKKWAFAEGLKVHNLPKFNKEVYDFMSNLKFYFTLTIDGKDFVFSHAGIKEGVPLENQDEFSLMFNKEFYREYEGDKIVMIGHRPVQTVYGKDCTIPMKVPDKNILMVDTRCKKLHGYCSCVNVLTGEFWQSDKDW